MEFKCSEADGTEKEKLIDEEKTLCDKLVTNKIFGRGTGILKNSDFKNL